MILFSNIMAHNHHHHHGNLNSKKLYLAVAINLLLTVFQIIGGIISGSLSLVADAVHNLSDAGALGIAAIANKIADLPSNHKMTYGYRRAEILGALINSTTLLVVGLYLLYESTVRYLNPREIDGSIVVLVASIALVIDLITAFLTYSGAKDSINIKAAFIHNVSDAMASVVVIISGLLIMNYKLYVVDLVATVLISVYVLYHSFFLLKQCILILMQSTPSHLDVQEIKSKIETINLVEDVHHIHVWQLDDKKILFESHIVIKSDNLDQIETVKKEIKESLKSNYAISHSTLEIEVSKNCLDQ